jgi:TolA-binding protein
MKSVIIAVLTVAVIVFGFSVFSLQKELLSAKESTTISEKRNEELQRELMRVNRLYTDKECFLSEIEQTIAELDGKIDLETLERYIPKKKWSEIEPVIDKLKAFRQERENERND